jgi:hypothetical protein
MTATSSESPTGVQQNPEFFYERFNTAFARVYRFIDRRVESRSTTELLTCEVLLRSLDALVTADEPTSALMLFANTDAVLREHEERATRAESYDSTDAALMRDRASDVLHDLVRGANGASARRRAV